MRLPLFPSSRAVFPSEERVELLYDDTEVTQARIRELRAGGIERVFVSLLLGPPPPFEVHPIGTIARVVELGGAFAMAEGEERGRLLGIERLPGGPMAEVDPLPSLEPPLESVAELMRSLREVFFRWATRTGRVPGVFRRVGELTVPSRMAYGVAALGPLTQEERQQVLSELDPTEQLELARAALLRRERQI